jgi:hypothetical protein
MTSFDLLPATPGSFFPIPTIVEDEVDVVRLRRGEGTSHPENKI